eukprot:Rhum_TRINITY_DN9373_c0_g2::Rhum_TRINITY_DN9373_c0_g2_i1::g.33151::m.33151/K18749/LSM14, RAP55, SCD6; protein LSM14
MKNGQALSIISKSNIRYEGTLQSIDPVKNTVTIERVTMHGTEDRPGEFIAAQPSTVFDFIVFNGCDVKDISIFQDTPAAPNDPAIVRAGKAIESALLPASAASGAGAHHHHHHHHSQHAAAAAAAAVAQAVQQHGGGGGGPF